MKQITIYELLPRLPPGYVAMEKNGIWYWYDHEPVPDNTGIWIFLHGGDLYELGAFNIERFEGDWKDSLMKCGKQDVHDKVTLKTPVGDIATTPVGPSDVCIAPKIEEFSFSIELINGAKISFEGIPNNAGLTDEQLTTFFEDLFSVKEIKKMKKLSDYKRLPIDTTNNICEKCGQRLEHVFVPCGGFFPPGRYLLCPKCHTVKKEE